MPRKWIRETDASGQGIGRRNYLRMAGAAAGGGALLGTGGAVEGARAATVVDLGDEGLSEGDVIDGYLRQYFESGNEVRIPAGEYEWRGNGLGDRFDEDAALVGDGDVVFRFTSNYWNDNFLVYDNADVRIENVTVRGRVESGRRNARLRIDCRDDNATFTLDNFNLPDGSSPGDQAMALYVGKPHAGEITIRNCHIEGWNNNGLYSGAQGKPDGGQGTVNVEGCFFKDCNIDAVRMGGPNDSITDTVIVQDDAEVDDDGNISGRALRFRYAGENITVRNVHITSDLSSPFIVASRMSGSGSGTVEDLYVRNKTGTTAVRVAKGDWTANNVNVTGSGNRNVSGFDSASNVCTRSCESPATSLAELDGFDGDGGGGGDDDGGSSDGLDRILTVDGEDGQADYRFSVSEDVEKSTAGGASINGGDTVSGTTVEGGVRGGSDSYAFAGEVTDFTLDGDAKVVLDGDTVDPTSLGTEPTNVMTLEGTDDTEKQYELTVSGELEQSNAGGASINPDDSVSGSTATGFIYGSADSYEYTGEVTDLEVSDGIVVFVNGTRVDPATLGPDPDFSNVLTIQGSGRKSEDYELTVGGDLIKSTANGATVDSGDTVSGSTATGTVAGGADSYEFSGEVTDFEVDDGATVTLNGTEVDPDALAPEPLPNRVVFDGSASDGPAVYAVEVSNAIEASAELGTLEGDDAVGDTKATGTVTDGVDGFRFRGDLVSFDLAGTAIVTVEDNDG
jgi:hypothetical protein